MTSREQILSWMDEYGSGAPLKIRMLIPIARGFIEDMDDEDFEKYLVLMRKIMCPDCERVTTLNSSSEQQ